MTHPDHEPPTGTESLPLAGYTVAVTAARRREELGALLQRRGARVVHAPAVRIVPLEDDADLVAATRRVLERPVDLVIATTGVGFRGWLEAASAWDLPLVEHLRPARILARGPKARGAIRGGGLVDAWSPESESSAEVLQHLLSGAEGPLVGRRIAIQLHGDPLADLVAGLRTAGADVVTVPVYRWVLPEDVAPLQALVSSIAAGSVDAVTFTSAPAAASLLAVAGDLGLRDAVTTAFRGRVVPVAVGPVTAAPLVAADVLPHQPARARLADLAREVVTRLPLRDPVVEVAGHRLQVRGSGAAVDDRFVDLDPLALTLLAALAEQPGALVSADGQTASRLRASLGAPLVETVGDRGYRLAV